MNTSPDGWRELHRAVTGILHFIDSILPKTVPIVADERKEKEDNCYDLYVLACRENKYYIGRVRRAGATTVARRYRQHKSGLGSAWTRRFPPLRIVKVVFKQDKWAEDRLVMKYMEKYGTENVRGGTYSQVQLTPVHLEALTSRLRSTNNACFKCGQLGHFVNACTVVTKATIKVNYFEPMDEWNMLQQLKSLDS